MKKKSNETNIGRMKKKHAEPPCPTHSFLAQARALVESSANSNTSFQHAGCHGAGFPGSGQRFSPSPEGGAV